MDKNTKQRLINLGADALADALIELASYNDEAENLVERMTSTSEEKIKRYKAKIAGLKRRRSFVHWRESGALASKLNAMLSDLEAAASDPRTGAELVIAFYETDKGVFGHCDDSSGIVSWEYASTAKKLFVAYASKCQDKDWLAKRVLKLNREDDYGVRDTLIHCAVDYLDESHIRTMIAHFQKLADEHVDEYKRSHCLRSIESLTRQIKDAPLFEKTKLAHWKTLPTAACIDIGQVYLESGDAETALSWLERIPDDDRFRTSKRDELLLKILNVLGDTRKEADVAWRMFRRSRSMDGLERYLLVVGQDNKEEIIDDEVVVILDDNNFSIVNAAFLMELRRMDEAETYLIARADQLDGDLYGSLLPIAKEMRTHGRQLAATVVFRALLDSILDRGHSKTYSHGVRYLKTLDELAQQISHWQSLKDHEAYKSELIQKHGRKYTFWSRYES